MLHTKLSGNRPAGSGEEDFQRVFTIYRRDGTRIVQSLYFLNPNFKPLAIFCSGTAWFVWDQVRNPQDQFSQNEAHIKDVD